MKETWPMALKIKLIMAQSSEPRQDLTIIRNFIDHSHHNLASFFLNILIGGLVRGLTCHFPLGWLVLMRSTEPTMQQRNIPQYPMEFIKPAINLQNEFKTCKLTAQHTGAKRIFFTACHSGKLKLAFTSPDNISTSPKNVLTSRIDFTVLLLFEFLIKHHLPQPHSQGSLLP